MNPFSRKETVLFILILMITALVVFGSRTHRLYLQNSIKSEVPVELLLYEQAGLSELAEIMDSLDIEYDREELIWAGETLGWRFFRPGRYYLDKPYTYSGLLSKIARGIQDAQRVTVLPGTDKNRLSLSLSRQLQADSTEFREIFADSSELALELGLTGEVLFSRMLPNTYEIYWTTSAAGAVRRIHTEFTRLVQNRYQDEINAHPLNLDEIVILASIVEWEARINDEKPKIAGLYLNRLNSNMLLQADPTVIYALGERRRLLFEDYRFEHPYNTYLHSGLPPGPITNPDDRSIVSVLRSEEHDYLFMVATPEGSHRFSRTFEEHRQASEEWRRWIREQHRIRDELERQQEQSKPE